jgi:hypothetical protein
VKDKSGKTGVDFIGRFELLATDFAKVCDCVGIVPPLALPHVFNSHRACHYSNYYDEESADWIRKRFAVDIEQFGYEFEQPFRMNDMSEAKPVPNL